MCAAHAAALLACDAQGPLARLTDSTAQRVLLGLAITIACAPMATGLDPALHRLFDRLCDRVAAQVRQGNHLKYVTRLGAAWALS